MKKHATALILLSALGSALHSAPSFAAQDARDCAVLTGAKVMADALRVDHFDSATFAMEPANLVIHFTMNRNLALRVADGLERRVVPEIGNDLAKTALTEIIKDVRSATQTGFGGPHYWDTVIRKDTQIYHRAAEKFVVLTAAVCR